MKKSTLLSLATAGAIVATSVGTFAAWDTTDATSTGTVNFGTPVTVTAGTAPTYETANRSLNVAPTSKGTVSFKVKDEKGLASTLKLSATVPDAQKDLVDVTFEKDGVAGTAITEDTAVIKDGTTENKYTVIVKPKSGINDTDLAKLNNTDISVDVKATLE